MQILILLLFHFCLGVAANLVTYSQVYSDGSYAWFSRPAVPGALSRDQMRSLVKQAYEEMVHDAVGEGVPPPSTMALLVVPGVVSIYHSSIRNRRPTGRALLNVCDDRQHRYQGNCAELAAIDEVRARLDQLKAEHKFQGAYLVVYGIKDLLSGQVDWLAPCGDKDEKTGCSTVLASDDFSCITRRGLEHFEWYGDGVETLTRRTILERAAPAKGSSAKGPSTKAPPVKSSPTNTSPGKVACKGSKVKRFIAEPGPEISLSFRRSLAAADGDWLDLFR